MSGTLFVVATPIGNLDDITARAIRVLREVSLIAAEDTRRTAHLLARYGITTATTSLHEHNEEKKTGAVLERLRRGESVALVSDAGTPTVSDPGHRLIIRSIEAGVRVEPVPGPSAALAALVASGLPSETFTFLGFPPIRSKDRNIWFERLVSVAGTIVFFEAPHRIEATMEQLLLRAGDCQVAVARELTKIHEELVRGPISEVLGKLSSPRGEYTIVAYIGQTTNTDRPWAASDADILLEYGHITENTHLTRRATIAKLARKHGRPSSEIYDAIERAKKSAES